MSELAFDDLILGKVVLSIEGRVVEYFTEQHGSVARVHLRQVHCETTGPDRKGHYEVSVSPSPGGQGGFKITIDANTWPALAPLLGELRTADPGPP